MARLFQFYIVNDDSLECKQYKDDGVVAAENYQDAMRKIADWYGEECIVSVELFELEELVLLNGLRPHAQSGD